MKLARAYVRTGGRWTRFVEQITEPPRWARSLSAWTVSAALASAVLLVLTSVATDGALRAVGADSLAILGISLILASLLFVPWQFSIVFYFSIFQRPTSRNGAAWCAGFHGAAHIALMAFLAEPLTCHLAVSLLVASLWGSWLPRIDNPFAATRLDP